MKNTLLTYAEIVKARSAYRDGRNVIESLRLEGETAANSIDAIEISYDLQAGTYIDVYHRQKEHMGLYASELATVIQSVASDGDVVLDVGTGESTTLSLVVQRLDVHLDRVYACDLSWSRIYKGREFAKGHMGETISRFSPFVADMAELPLPSSSVNVTISSHALEPNGGALRELLLELFRVTRDRLILFEPCYERNSDEGKRRMDQLGYIKGMSTVVTELGGNVVEEITIKNVANPLNPTVGFVIEPPATSRTDDTPRKRVNDFSMPGSDYILERIDDFLFSRATGLCFPILKGIPILRAKSAILASSLVVE